MIEKLSDSSGPVVGYKVVGKVTVEDYQQLDPEIQALVNQYDKIYLLLNIQKLTGEEIKAWMPDLQFGHRFHDKIIKIAIVGDKQWDKWLTAFVDPFYAKEARFFHQDEMEEAWAWLRGNE